VGLLIGSVTTATPDLIVMAIAVMIAWRMIADHKSLVPLLFACGGFLAKASGVLALPVTLLYVRRGWIIALCVVAPILIASVTSSGCLLFPNSITCLPVPWAVPVEQIKRYSDLLYFWARWGASNATSDYWQPAFLLGQYPHMGSLAWSFRSGILFLFVPDLRFNFGFFLIPPALLAMRVQWKAIIPMRLAHGGRSWTRGDLGGNCIPRVLSFLGDHQSGSCVRRLASPRKIHWRIAAECL
jgi:hypothetical protein